MGRMIRAGFIGMKGLTSVRVSAAGSHVTTADVCMPLWCIMLSKVCVQKDRLTSLPHG